ELRRGRREADDGARAIGLSLVDEVVVDLHHDRGSGVYQHPGPGRRVVIGVAGHPGADPGRRAEPVVRRRVGRGVSLGQARPSKAGPAVAAGGVVQSSRIGCVLSRCLEQDHVVHDRRALRLDDGARDVSVLRQVRLEEETVVVVEPTASRLGEIALRRRERHRRSGRLASSADRLDRLAVAEPCTASNPASNQLLLGGREDPLRLSEIQRRVAARHPRRQSSHCGGRRERCRRACGSRRTCSRRSGRRCSRSAPTFVHSVRRFLTLRPRSLRPWRPRRRRRPVRPRSFAARAHTTRGDAVGKAFVSASEARPASRLLLTLVKRLGVLVAVALALALTGGKGAPAQQLQANCSLFGKAPLWLDFADGSVPFWNMFAKPGITALASNFIFPPKLRAGGAQTAYFDLYLNRRVGTTSKPADPATIVDKANKFYEYAAQAMDC